MRLEGCGLAISGFHFKMRYRIISKIREAGATSIEKAVTSEEAGFNMEEQQWLDYFAGVFLGRVKKTKDKRYYI